MTLFLMGNDQNLEKTPQQIRTYCNYEDQLTRDTGAITYQKSFDFKLIFE